MPQNWEAEAARFRMQAYLRSLTHCNLQRLIDAIGVLYQPIRTQQLPGHFAAVLKELIPGDFHGVATVSRPKSAPDRVRREIVVHPLPARWESLADAFSSHYPEFPLRSIRESGNLHQPLAISDVASRQEIESLELYHNFYRILGVEDDLSVNFGNSGHRVCLAILRGRRGFSEQDRAILGVLRAHMERAYRYARTLISMRLTAQGESAASADLGSSGGSKSDPSRSLRRLGLSEREAEILYWVAAGKSSPVISTILGIRHDTVRAHLKRIYAKLGVENRLSAALRALQIMHGR